MSAEGAKRTAERVEQEAGLDDRQLRQLARAVVELASEFQHLKRDLKRLTIRVNELSE